MKVEMEIHLVYPRFPRWPVFFYFSKVKAGEKGDGSIVIK